jgi:hypothetical protein
MRGNDAALATSRGSESFDPTTTMSVPGYLVCSNQKKDAEPGFKLSGRVRAVPEAL